MRRQKSISINVLFVICAANCVGLDAPQLCHLSAGKQEVWFIDSIGGMDTNLWTHPMYVYMDHQHHHLGHL